jgi:CheY-like chemotaxis protein
MGTTELQRIVCVDDEPDIRQVLTMSLEYTLGASVVALPTASEALAYLEGNPPPDVILLDGMMPDMDGVTLCSRLRQVEKLRQVPIVFLSARARPDEQRRALEAGATACIAKPFDPMSIGDQIRRAIAGDDG